MIPAPGEDAKPRFPMDRDERRAARLVVIGLGSNTDPGKHLPAAFKELSFAFHLLVRSTPYVGPPVGDGPAAAPGAASTFSNAAALIRTADTFDQIKGSLKGIEAALGREREDPRVVTIDLDILIIQGEVIRGERDRILVPHPDLCAYPHGSIPCAEVAPFLRHPLTNETVKEIADRLG